LFVRALDAKEQGDIDDAEDLLREIIRREPRLAEPHMELARICLDTDRLADAEPHAREALAHLAAGGPWTDELPDNVVEALAHAALVHEHEVSRGAPRVPHAAQQPFQCCLSAPHSTHTQHHNQ
jgi:hypothetical protein